jgi:hypothetical protein
MTVRLPLAASGGTKRTGPPIPHGSVPSSLLLLLRSLNTIGWTYEFAMADVTWKRTWFAASGAQST